jgi:hypothetical protein
MCPSGATCLPVDWYFSELALYKCNSACWFIYKADFIIISLKINFFSPGYSWKIAELALNNNHLLTRSKGWCMPFMLIFSLLVTKLQRQKKKKEPQGSHQVKNRQFDIVWSWQANWMDLYIWFRKQHLQLKVELRSVKVLIFIYIWRLFAK